MAIFFNHIKGCGASSTGQPNSVTDTWGWIRWADTASLGDTNETIKQKQFCWTPSLYIGTENNFSSAKDYGHIITSKTVGQYIETFFTFQSYIQVPGINLADLRYEEANIYWKNDQLYIVSDSGAAHCPLILKGSTIYLDEGDTTVNKKLIANDTTTLKKDTTIETGLHVGKDTSYSFPTDPGTIKADKKCEALYFNATSDRRAKYNITPSKFSALTVVKSLPIYTFNYLTDPEKTIGLIAQEASEFNLDGFNMVDNINATGKGSDMMQMKESKLVYVLWKAVQELSTEVEELKAEIRNLK